MKLAFIAHFLVIAASLIALGGDMSLGTGEAPDRPVKRSPSDPTVKPSSGSLAKSSTKPAKSSTKSSKSSTKSHKEKADVKREHVSKKTTTASKPSPSKPKLSASTPPKTSKVKSASSKGKTEEPRGTSPAQVPVPVQVSGESTSDPPSDEPRRRLPRKHTHPRKVQLTSPSLVPFESVTAPAIVAGMQQSSTTSAKAASTAPHPQKLTSTTMTIHSTTTHNSPLAKSTPDRTPMTSKSAPSISSSVASPTTTHSTPSGDKQHETLVSYFIKVLDKPVNDATLVLALGTIVRAIKLGREQLSWKAFPLLTIINSGGDAKLFQKRASRVLELMTSNPELMSADTFDISPEEFFILVKAGEKETLVALAKSQRDRFPAGANLASWNTKTLFRLFHDATAELLPLFSHATRKDLSIATCAIFHDWIVAPVRDRTLTPQHIDRALKTLKLVTTFAAQPTPGTGLPRKPEVKPISLATFDSFTPFDLFQNGALEQCKAKYPHFGAILKGFFSGALKWGSANWHSRRELLEVFYNLIRAAVVDEEDLWWFLSESPLATDLPNIQNVYSAINDAMYDGKGTESNYYTSTKNRGVLGSSVQIRIIGKLLKSRVPVIKPIIRALVKLGFPITKDKVLMEILMASTSLTETDLSATPEAVKSVTLSTFHQRPEKRNVV